MYRNRMTARDSYLHVLRSALWGEPLSESIPAGQLKEVLSIAKAQSTLPLVCQALLLSPGQELSDSQKVSMQNKLRSTVSLHLRSNHVIALLTAGLRARGIDPVLMKGQGVASYYKTPYLRECGDIDLYVGKARYTEACETVAAMAGIEDVPEWSERKKHYNVDVEGVPVELHWTSDLLPKRYDAAYQEYSLDGMTHGLVQKAIDGEVVDTPADSFNAFFIFNHAWHHFVTGGVGLRQFCDWAMLLHAKAGGLDLDHIKEILERLDLMDPWQVFGKVAVEHLGLPSEEMPFYNEKSDPRVEQVLDIVFREGNFGHERQELRNRPKNFFVAKTRSLMIHVWRYSKMMSMFGRVATCQFTEMLTGGIRTAAEEFGEK